MMLPWRERSKPAAIDYYYKILLIKWIGTHKEYDTIDALRVDYDENRYSDSAD